MTSSDFIGQSPERLSIEERKFLSGKWIALEIYTPKTTPERRIEAVGISPASCIQQLRERGLDPGRYELIPVKTSF